MEARVLPLLLAVTAGVLIGAVVMQVAAPPVAGTSVPSHALSSATGCVGGDDPRGWIGAVPNPDHRAVYLVNYTAVHEAPDVEIRGELTEPESGAWVLAITVTPVSSEKTAPETCQPRSVIDASVALPTDAGSLTITVDGETVTTIDTDTRAPRFSYLSA